MRPEKTAFLDNLRSDVTEATFVLLTDYRGLSVGQTTELRGQLHEAGAVLRVVRNRTFRQLTAELSCSALDEGLVGPTAMVCGGGDVVEIAKLLKDFAKANKLPVMKMGMLRSRILSAEDIKILADLPPRPQLLGMVVGTIAAPMTQLVGVLNQKLASVVYVLKAVQEKKSTE